MILIYLVCLLAETSSTEHGRVIGEPGNGEKISLDVTLKKSFMISISGQPDPPQSFFRQSTNLYDFQKHLQAIKIVEEDVCYITPFTLKYMQVKKIVDTALADKSHVMTQVIEQWNIPGREIKSDELTKTVGIKITKFCSGYKVFWMEGGHAVTNNIVKRLIEDWGVSISGSISIGDFSASGSASGSGGSGSASSSASSSTGSHSSGTCG